MAVEAGVEADERPQVVGARERGVGVAVDPDDLGRDALADLRLVARIGQDHQPAVAVQIDEPGSDVLSARVDRPDRRRRAECLLPGRARRLDPEQAVRGHPDRARVAGRARSVHERAALDPKGEIRAHDRQVPERRAGSAVLPESVPALEPTPRRRSGTGEPRPRIRLSARRASTHGSLAARSQSVPSSAGTSSQRTRLDPLDEAGDARSRERPAISRRRVTLARMPPWQPERRDFDRGRRLSRSIQVRVGGEYRAARLAAGLSQADVGRAAGMSHGQVSRVERAALHAVTVDQLCRLGAALGLEPSVRAYPVGDPIRDRAHLELLERLRARLPPTWRWRTEVPLPGPAIDGRGMR